MNSNRPFSPNAFNSIDYYNQNAQAFFDGTAHIDVSSLYEKFEKHLPSQGHILDAGCGSGRDTAYFLKKGYQVTSFDASDEMVRLAAEFTGHPILLQTFQGVNEIGTFDGIWACASLLHVDRTQIDDIFIRLSRALKTSGILYSSFKYGNEEVMRHGRLFNNYTEESFRRLLSHHAELSIAEIWITEDVRADRKSEKWLNVVLVKE